MNDARNINKVVRNGLCLQCGTCVSVCPKNCITLTRDKQRNYTPVIDERRCNKCGLCLRVCPGNEFNLENKITQAEPKYKTKWSNEIGQYIDTFIGYSNEDKVRERASSGGIVSTILLHLLETGKIKGALVVKGSEGRPSDPQVFIARNPKEITDSMQSKYYPVPLNSKFKEIEKINGKIAIVGLPCHLHGLEKYETFRKGLSNKIFLKIGLFCGLNLTFDSLNFFVHKAKKNLKDLSRISYREGRWPGKMVLYFGDGDKCTLDKGAVNHVFTLQRCIFCIDHTSESADISCGDAWLPRLLNKGSKGWSAIISRSSRGEEVLNSLQRENKASLERVSVKEIIQSQNPRFIFKRKNSWARLKLARILGVAVPSFDQKSLDRLGKSLKFPYLVGNILLLFVLSAMKYDLVSGFVRKIPLKVLKVYELIIIRLLYREESFYRKILEKKINKVKNFFGFTEKAKKLYGYFKKATILPFLRIARIILKKIDTLTEDSKNYFQILKTGTLLSDEEFYRALVVDSKRKNELIKDLKNNIEKVNLLRWPTKMDKQKKIISLISKSEKGKIIGAADKFCEHKFNLLGSGEVQVSYGLRAKGFEGYLYNTQANDKDLRGKRERSEREAQKLCGDEFSDYELIDWWRDFKSGYRWDEKTWYRNIQYGHKPGIDIILPWELSRFQHLPIMGEAYWLTRDDKYAREFVCQISDWIKNNPPLFGVNWLTAMDAAIRVCNWMLGFYFFKDAKQINDEFLVKFFKSLLIHGKYIKKNLVKNWQGLTSNHYLSGIAGLVYLGVLFKKTKIGQEWLNFGIEELKNEMRRQVYLDGCDFEASTYYHRLVLELFFFSTLSIIISEEDFNWENHKEIAEKIFGKEYVEQLLKMFEAVLFLLRPDGKMPQVGDNDNGRMHTFVDRDISDMRYLLTLGAVFFKEPRFKIKEFGFSEDSLWIFGEKGYGIWENLKEFSIDDLKNKFFPDAGWYVIRNDRDYCLISCGPNGKNGNGGHCHNDKLSFELCLGGKNLIVDPGTYIYTAQTEWRNKFRSTGYHNTLVVNGIEQNTINQNRLFRLRDETKCKNLFFGEIGDKIIFEGEHYGYSDKIGMVHKRRIELDKRESSLEIKDTIAGDIGKRKYFQNFVFHPSIFKKNLDILGSDKIKTEIYEIFYSSEYGKKEKTYAIKVFGLHTKIWKEGDKIKILCM